MLEAGSVVRTAGAAVVRARNGELAMQLRAAAMAGDEGRLSRLLSELLRLQGLGRSQRLLLQQKTLSSLVHSLRALSLNDDLTGLHNTRGFMQAGTRLLDVAVRDAHPAWLVCFDVDRLRSVNESAGRGAGDRLIRETGDFMRDLFPNHGVDEVLGRLGGDEFAALTLRHEYASRSTILLRARRPQTRPADVAALSLSIGVAPFDPGRPVGIGELLAGARVAMQEHKRATHIASSELTPRAV